MAAGKSVFLIGPGFIGHNIVDILTSEGYNVTALTRRESQADVLSKSGVTPVLGSLTDSSLITEYVAKSDITYQCASGDNLPLLEATLAGIRQRAKADKPTTYIHTSGAKILCDNVRGMHKSDKTYSDLDPAGIDSVPDDAPHRHVDTAIVQAQRELKDHLKAAIMMPPEVYGYDSKHDRLSMTVPRMTRFALNHGYPPMIGRGEAIDTAVHVHDQARGYVEVLHHLESMNQGSATENLYWFCEDGHEFTYRDLADTIGKALHERGRIADPTPREPPEALFGELSGANTLAYAGSNCRGYSDRLRSLGWTAREKGIWQSYLEDELPVILKAYDEQKQKQ